MTTPHQVWGRTGTLAALVPLLLAGPSAGPACAHSRSLSYSSWTLHEGQARVVVRVPEIELTRLPFWGGSGDAARLTGRYFATRLQLIGEDGACPIVENPRPAAAGVGWIAYEWRIACPHGRAISMRNDAFFDVAPSHVHFARVGLGDGPSLERVLSDGERVWTLGVARRPPGGTSIVAYVALGVEHILSGLDHLAFLMALLLLATSLAEVASLVSGFTLAHSITLALAVLGVVRPQPQAVEALIGFSIALVAVENAWLLGGRGRLLPLAVTATGSALVLLAMCGVGVLSALTLVGLTLFCACHFALLDRVERPARLRAAVAFTFGLVHGFGFAGVLAEMELPTARLVPALFGFNLGVEIGQLAVVGLLWSVLSLAARGRRAPLRGTLAEVGSAVVCGLGVFWFVSRAFG